VKGLAITSPDGRGHLAVAKAKAGGRGFLVAALEAAAIFSYIVNTIEKEIPSRASEAKGGLCENDRHFFSAQSMTSMRSIAALATFSMHPCPNRIK